MATLNLGRIKPVFQGAYNNSTAYVVDDIVTFGDETFICIQASTGNATSNASYWTKLAAKGTDGTDVGTTITTQGDILYRDASGLARLGAGTSGQVLQTNGTGANPSWGTVSSDFVLLSTDNITSSTASVSRDVFSSTYQTYKVIINGIQPTSAANSNLYYRWRRSSADLTDSNYYNHAHQAYWNNSTNTDGVHNETWGGDYGRIMATNHKTGGEYGANYDFTIFNANSSTIVPQLIGLGTLYDDNGYHRHLRFSSWYQGSNKDVTGIKIYFAGTNIGNGNVKIYGLK